MSIRFVLPAALIATLAVSIAQAQPFPPPFNPISATGPFLPNEDGRMNVQLIATNGANSGNVAQWTSIWNALDTNPTATGAFAGTVINNNQRDTENSFNYQEGPNDIRFFPAGTPTASINNNGPGGGGGAFGPAGDGGSNYSIRAQALLRFTTGGTYSIGMGSDDGRRLELTGVTGAPFAGFTAFGEAITTSGANFFTHDGCCNESVGIFTVSAGDVLALEAFYHEGGGGDYGEIAIKQGSDNTWDASEGWELLADGALGGILQISSTGASTPEPTSIAVWSLIGVVMAGFGYRRYRQMRTK